MGIHVLGTTSVDETPLRPRDRQVLTALAVRRDRVVTPEELADAVWRDRPPTSWPKQVQICVGRLRKALGSAAIATEAGGYRLDGSAVDLDLDRFEELVERARDHAATGEPDRCAALLTRALAQWRGTPYGDLDGWEPVEAERARLEELRRTAEEELLDARLAIGEHREVAGEAEALVAAEPLRERRWSILALAQYRSGRQADALRTLHRARRRLVEQLGVDPGQDLADLETAILRHDAELLGAPAPRTVSGDCPWKGLAAYDEGDFLYGRDDEIAACVARLRQSPFLVVAGPSGCGKSSLVRAGLVPALRRMGRRVQVTVPESSGLAVPTPGEAGEQSALLVVDQLEQLFGAGDAEQARDTCRRLATYAAESAPVVVVVRADHLAHLAVDPTLSRLAERGLHLVSPLDGEALREVIERPAREAGLRIEQGLVDLLVSETEGAPGALPLLSHALAETWLRREGNVLTVEGYRASGGIRGAVARSADLLYDSLPPDERSTLRSLLLRLVTPSTDGMPVRCRVRAERLGGAPDRERVLSLLIGARLVTAEDEVVEISHEALVRAWPRLQAWLDDDSAGQRVVRHLTAAADDWESRGRPDSELYRGARLETALEYRASARPHLTPVETAFLEASEARATSERAVLEARAREDARRNRRLRGLLAVALVLLLIAGAAGVVALDRADEAREQRDVAAAAVDSARLESLVNQSLALRPTNRDVAALLAVEALRRWPDDPRALSAVLGSLTAAGGFLGYRHLVGAESLLGALVPGTTQAVVSTGPTGLVLVDLPSGRLEQRFPELPADAGEPVEVRVSADGGTAAYLLASPAAECWDLVQLAETGGEGCARLWVYDVASGEPLLDGIVPVVGAGDTALNRDGSLVAVAGGYRGDLVVHRVGDGEEVRRVVGPSRPLDAGQYVDTAAVAFGPDDTLYVGSLDGRVRVLEAGTLRRLATYRGPAYSTHQHLAVVGDRLLVGAGSEQLVALAQATGEVRWTADLRGTHPDPCPWFAVAPSGERVYCGSHYGEIDERDGRTGALTGVQLDPQLGSVGDLALSADGRELVAFGAQTPVLSRWRLDGSGLVTRRVADGYVAADGYDFDGGRTLVVARRGSAATVDMDFDDFEIWDAADDRSVDSLDVPLRGVGWAGRDTIVGLDITTARFGWYDVDRQALVDGVEVSGNCQHLWASAAGERAYCGFPHGEVWTIDPATRQRIDPTIEVDGEPFSVSATRGGERVVVTAHGRDGAVTTVHDGRTGEPIGDPLVGPHNTAVSLDGVLVGAGGGRLTRYDLETGRPIADLAGARGEINTLQFSADGRLLLATSNDQSASLYDVATGIRIGDPIASQAPFIYPAFLRPDGHELAVTDRRGIAVWDLDPGHLRAAACRLAGRNLTATEWSSYLDGLGRLRATCPGLPWGDDVT